MHHFEDYFSEANIIKALCQLRLKKAKVVHERHFFRKLVYSTPERQNTTLHEMFPPRRTWNRYRPRKARRDVSPDIDMETILLAIKAEKKKNVPAPWFHKLISKCDEIRSLALADTTYEFSKPRITHQHKSENDYRAIASFDKVNDKLMDIINAKYLREQLDMTLESSSVAFRAKSKVTLNRSSAISQIISHRKKATAKPLYVAECDIKGFFDCVSHTQAKKALKRSIEILKIRKPKLEIDPRAIKIFERYLASYSFSRSVKTEEKKLREATENPKAVYKWPLQFHEAGPFSLEHFHKAPKRKKLGIPQGGAHSCLIANLILDLADKETNLALCGLDGESTYLRYCDDIILICEKNETCEKGFAAYLKALEFLELPYHKPEQITNHGRDFFNKSKTKSPYRWVGGKSQGNFPWIQFLGYQIRHDALLRVRPSSIAKHKLKIKTLREKITSEINSKEPKVSARRFLYRYNSKVIAFSTGRVNLHALQPGPLPMCWCSGFSLLHGESIVKSQIKDLDKEAHKHRRHLENRLGKLKDGAKAQNQDINAIDYFGKPFSHMGQFEIE